MPQTRLPRRDDFSLKPASLEDGIEIWQMIREIGPGENGFGNSGYDVPFSRFASYLQRRLDMAKGVDLAPGHVPQTTYYLRLGSLPIGLSKLRHRLTDGLRLQGGHIGYCIRPSERGRGYGDILLSLTLREAARMGIDHALITVDDANVPSWRMVERNRGVCEKKENGIRYYRVPTTLGE